MIGVCVAYLIMHTCGKTVKGAIPEHHFLQPCRDERIVIVAHVERMGMLETAARRIDPWLQVLYADLEIAAFRIIERRIVLRQTHGLL